MSDLQIGLIALGVLLILLVLGFNWWQDRRVRRKMQTHFPLTDQDPLLGGTHAAPGAQNAPSGSRLEPAFDSDGRAPADAAAAVGEHDDAEEADPAVEVVIDVAFGHPVSGAELLPYLQSMRYVGQKPVRVFALSEAGSHRYGIRSDESYNGLQLAVLLANRSGALTAIEWSQAWARAQEMAERFDAALEGPDQQATLEHAAKLDDVCAALDTQVGLTLLLGRAQPAAEVLAIMREMGFVHERARLAWMSDHGIACFTVTRGDGATFDAGVGGIERLDMLLDVPCNMADDRAFGRMVDVGRELASRLRADLVDDQGRPLPEGAETTIDERLRALFAQLDQAGLRAGSPRAQRVFS